MGNMKMFGLAVLMALAWTALSTGTASATVLCHTTSTPCTSDWNKGAELAFSLASGSSASFNTTPGATVHTCTESTLTGEVEDTGGGDRTVLISVPVEGWTWGGCTGSTKTVTGGTLEIHHIPGTDNGTVTASGVTITISSPLIGHCHYGAGPATHIGVLIAGKEGTDGTLAVDAVLERIGSHTNGILCPVDLRWRGEYTQTTETHLYVEPS